MYKKYLKTIDFFDHFEESEIKANVLDPLTKVVNRKYTMKFMEHLISKNQPFTFIMLDLDNFKMLNDNYGHIVGDIALREFSKALIKYVGKNGVVGRYGGDEFIIVYLGDTKYEVVYKFIYDFFEDKGIIRKNYKIGEINQFITATIGASSFPKDGNTVSVLFEKTDKALYRGKVKGRNCFIIYVHEKHKDIDKSKLVKEPLYKILARIQEISNNSKDVNHRRQSIFNHVKYMLNNTNIALINTDYSIFVNNKLINVNDEYELKNISTKIFDEFGYFYTEDVDKIKYTIPQLYKLCYEHGILSILINKYKHLDDTIQYIVFTEAKIHRIWQDDDLALAFYVNRIA